MVESVSVGSLYEIALETKEPNTTDLSEKIAFGWTGVQVRVNKYGNHWAEDIEAIIWDEKENTISLVIKNFVDFDGVK